MKFKIVVRSRVPFNGPGPPRGITSILHVKISVQCPESEGGGGGGGGLVDFHAGDRSTITTTTTVPKPGVLVA